MRLLLCLTLVSFTALGQEITEEIKNTNKSVNVSISESCTDVEIVAKDHGRLVVATYEITRCVERKKVITTETKGSGWTTEVEESSEKMDPALITRKVLIEENIKEEEDLGEDADGNIKTVKREVTENEINDLKDAVVTRCETIRSKLEESLVESHQCE